MNFVIRGKEDAVIKPMEMAAFGKLLKIGREDTASEKEEAPKASVERP